MPTFLDKSVHVHARTTHDIRCAQLMLESLYSVAHSDICGYGAQEVVSFNLDLLTWIGWNGADTFPTEQDALEASEAVKDSSSDFNNLARRTVVSYFNETTLAGSKKVTFQSGHCCRSLP